MKLKKTIWTILMLSIGIQLFGCTPAQSKSHEVRQHSIASSILSPEAMQNQPPASNESNTIVDPTVAAVDFAVSLLQNTYDGSNCILSPYSVYASLAMAANGAGGDTLKQMESLLGLTNTELNVYLNSLLKSSGRELQSANSIWYRQDSSFAPSEEFLRINADFYNADICAADFSKETVTKINNWANDQTNGRIETLLKEIDPNTVMFLISALTLDAEWQTPYIDSNITNDVFHSDIGDETAEMMHSEESIYLCDDNAIGFMKPYKGEQYSFLALLPNGDLDRYIASLSGEALLSLVKNASSETVFATMPKYKLEFDAVLNEPLARMGMIDAFTEYADLSRMSNSDLFISQVLHKTYLKVDELGTQAGAVTSVAIASKGVALNPKNVVLDRPFIMGIYDNINECFVFLGAIHSVES